MGKIYDVVVDRDGMSIEVIIPMKFIGIFTRYFGQEFPFTGSIGDGKFPGRGDNYHPRPNSYHPHFKGCRVVVSVQKNEEEKFDNFLSLLCSHKEFSLYDDARKRKMSLDITIPAEYMEFFVQRLGKEFPLDDGEWHYPHLNNWHVVVSVKQNEEEKFNSFLRGFCAERELSLLL